MERSTQLFAEASESVSQLDMLEVLARQSLNQFGFGDFMLSRSSVDAGVEIFGSFNRSYYFNVYHAERLNLVDPIVRKLTTSWVPIVWDFYREDDNEFAGCGRLFEKSLAVGYARGISVPIKGPFGQSYTFVCIFRGNEDDFTEHARVLCHEMLVFGAYLASAHRRLSERPKSAAIVLTRRECECLAWVPKGKTAWETARILSLSERTVNFHLQNAMAKLNVPSKHQAYLEAMNLGLIGSN